MSLHVAAAIHCGRFLSPSIHCLDPKVVRPLARCIIGAFRAPFQLQSQRRVPVSLSACEPRPPRLDNPFKTNDDCYTALDLAREKEHVKSEIALISTY